jgi:coatomer protein complex subunit gamma
VIYEGANALCALPNVTQRELSPAITVLQLFLCSTKPTLRFAAVRTLNRIAMLHPMAVTPCNMDMEGLINDSNRSIATLAITTLLKTGSETGVERLMKQITTFMCEIADEFKVIVVDAIRAMCIKFPQKHRLLMTFLSNMLREEGGFAYKQAIVESILELIAQIPDAKDAGLMHLCEFIEDCEFTALSTAILAVLGTEGPRTAEPSAYIRFIYNRVVLENATVRAAAVSALAKFGVQLPQLRGSIVTLLRRCLHDNDDEVRDRATLFCAMLDQMETSPDDVFGGLTPAALCLEPLPVPLLALERAVSEYLAAPTDEPFSVFSVTMSAEMLAAERKAVTDQAAARRKGGADDAPPGTPAKRGDAQSAASAADYLNKIPQFAHVGPRFSSSKPVALTDPETEYSATCVKHVYAAHTILAFELRTTIEDQQLEQVTVACDLSGLSGFELEAELPAAVLPFDTSGQAFVCLRRTEAAPVGSVGCTLRFRVRDVHPETHELVDAAAAGYEDEYALEELELTAADYMKRLMISDFRGSWEVRARARAGGARASRSTQGTRESSGSVSARH